MPCPRCPESASADDVFQYLLELRQYVLAEFREDPAGFMQAIPDLLGQDEACANGEHPELHRRVRTEMRCAGCVNVAKLVEDAKRRPGVPFVIETGEMEGRAYVLHPHAVPVEPLRHCQRFGDTVEIVLARFYHLLLVGFLLEDASTADLGNEVMTGYLCGNRGVLLSRVPATHALPAVDTPKSLAWFVSYLHRLVQDHDLVHHRPALLFNHRSDWIQVCLDNLNAISLRTGAVRLLVAPRTHASPQGHPDDPENFHGSKRVWSLFDHQHLQLGFARVLSVYYLLTLLLLHGGDWLRCARDSWDLAGLYGEKGLRALTQGPPDPARVRDVLDLTVIGRAKLDRFWASALPSR